MNTLLLQTETINLGRNHSNSHKIGMTNEDKQPVFLATLVFQLADCMGDVSATVWARCVKDLRDFL